jgi:NADH-quinone oxidoreductase subunit G
MSSEAFQPAISDFYLTNPIARASAVMAGLSQLRALRDSKLSAAE